ncbi:uncharacterized protein LOC111266299 isoform X2 [Varroa jacobsoni]|uniref:Uncharacterized protein n=1 Tax=Varroa destructor TaxID=109461 RepID=A0A7M7KAK1_VARDE|nr:uncharacterized protein LOC111251258 [Varroa destructor]XP_022699406.1 uncharacterized protein LOC111266299 isoform X2 [Varroa jacobsoni]
MAYASSYYRQSTAGFLIVLLINQAAADPIMTGIMQVATKEMVRNWMQSRARRSLAEEISATARSLGAEFAERTGGILAAIAVSPFLLPLWLPLMLLGSAFFMTTLAPSMIPAFVRSMTPLLNQLTPMLSSFGFDEAARALEPQQLARSLQPGELLERGLDVLDVRDSECRRKMFCELGSYTLDKQPAMARFLDLFSETVGRMFPSYAESLVRGIRGIDCGKIYEHCGVSPFGKVLNYYFV